MTMKEQIDQMVDDLPEEGVGHSETCAGRVVGIVIAQPRRGRRPVRLDNAMVNLPNVSADYTPPPYKVRRKTYRAQHCQHV